MRIITKPGQIRKEIKRLLGDPEDERIVAVAYVGADARSFLSSPSGLIIYCWPQAGGTNPNAIEELVRDRAKVRFVKRLHAKVYWSRNRGALIGSANLTANALGEHGLHEAAVVVPPGVFDMHSFLKPMRPEPDFAATLVKLHEEHVRFWQRNRRRGRPRVRPRLPLFPEWFVEGRPEWRIGWYEEDANPPKDAVDELEHETGSRKYATFLSCSERSDLGAGVFTLSFCIRAVGGVTKIKSLEWWAPEMATLTKKKSWNDWPWVWFGRVRIPDGTSPPFRCDTQFRKALAETIDESGGLQWLKAASLKPTKAFLNRLYRRYESNIKISRL